MRRGLHVDHSKSLDVRCRRQSCKNKNVSADIELLQFNAVDRSSKRNTLRYTEALGEFLMAGQIITATDYRVSNIEFRRQKSNCSDDSFDIFPAGRLRKPRDRKDPQRLRRFPLSRLYPPLKMHIINSWGNHNNSRRIQREYLTTSLSREAAVCKDQS